MTPYLVENSRALELQELVLCTTLSKRLSELRRSKGLRFRNCGLGFRVKGLGLRFRSFGLGGQSMKVSSNGENFNTPAALRYSSTHRPHSSSFWGLAYRTLNMNPKKELLWGLWVKHTLIKTFKPPTPKPWSDHQRRLAHACRRGCKVHTTTAGSPLLGW